MDRLTLDTAETVYFYEQDFYVLSNFSAFAIQWKGARFDTSEAVYQWEKFWFSDDAEKHIACAQLREDIRTAPSAHAALKLAEKHRDRRRPDWDHVKTAVMMHILWAKAAQHEYVRRKLLDTGSRTLIENSWRDDFWGWGADRTGKNELGKLWMRIREHLRSVPTDMIVDQTELTTLYGN